MLRRVAALLVGVVSLVMATAASAGTRADAIAAGQPLLESCERTCDALDGPQKRRPARIGGHQTQNRERQCRAGTNRAPQLSVVIPTRNRPLLLRRALGSFTRAGPQLEIIVVDDGSSPENASCNRAACEDLAGCRYVRLRRCGGAPAARNHGFRLSAGAYVWFMDDDDYATAQTVVDALNAVAIRTGPEILLMPRDTMLDGVRIGHTVPGDDADKLELYRRIGIEVTTSCALFPRPILVALNGWDEGLWALQDTDLFLRAARIATFAPLRTEPVRVDTSAPDRITYAIVASLIGKAQFLRKHWPTLPASRRLTYVAQILTCMPLLRAAKLRRRRALIRRQRAPAPGPG